MIIKDKKYFLAWFWKKRIKVILNKKSSKGILFPDKIIPTKKIKNRIGIIYLIIFPSSLAKYKGITKKDKIENLWIKPPAINSSPKGPPSFLSSGIVL